MSPCKSLRKIQMNLGIIFMINDISLIKVQLYTNLVYFDLKHLTKLVTPIVTPCFLYIFVNVNLKVKF